ncbi:MAG: MotA/TolQ/ExbB proton channel family protein [Wenzhouxiangella sp.]
MPMDPAQLAIDIYEAVRDFLELGGPVLVVIGWTVFLMWALILERTWFLRARLGKLASESLAVWQARPEHQSWHALRIRELLISNIKMAANARLPMITTLVALCPLLGLLGTVTGMIQVFDAMAFSGTGDARAMASGVSMATVPTMAGMVGALSGVLFVSILNGWARRQVNRFHDQMFTDQAFTGSGDGP